MKLRKRVRYSTNSPLHLHINSNKIAHQRGSLSEMWHRGESTEQCNTSWLSLAKFTRSRTRINYCTKSKRAFHSEPIASWQTQLKSCSVLTQYAQSLAKHVNHRSSQGTSSSEDDQLQQRKGDGHIRKTPHKHTAIISGAFGKPSFYRLPEILSTLENSCLVASPRR